MPRKSANTNPDQVGTKTVRMRAPPAPKTPKTEVFSPKRGQKDPFTPFFAVFGSKSPDFGD